MMNNDDINFRKYFNPHKLYCVTHTNTHRQNVYIITLRVRLTKTVVSSKQQGKKPFFAPSPNYIL